MLAKRLLPTLDRVAKKAGFVAGCSITKGNIHPKFSCDSWPNQIDFALRGSEAHAQALWFVAQAQGIDLGVSLETLMQMFYIEARSVMGTNPHGSLSLEHFPKSRDGALSAPLLKEAKSLAGYDSSAVGRLEPDTARQPTHAVARPTPITEAALGATCP